VESDPEDPDAHYELGTAVALAASYKATVEGDALPALREAKRAYTAHEKVLELDPRRKDAVLILGLYRYLVSMLPRAFRMVAYLVGFDGGKTEAIRLVEEAAAYPGDTRSEAQFALVLLYNRERMFGGAQRVLTDLKRRFPRNRLVWLESGSTWLRDDRAVKAEQALDVGFEKLALDNRTRMRGEESVWRLKRGASRVARGRIAEAIPDLVAARDGDYAWIVGHAHVELGKVADLKGERERARDEYDRARKLCGRAKHRRCVRTAEELKETGFSLD
jgi:tetratricopeptide (TPR) repeat protein